MVQGEEMSVISLLNFELKVACNACNFFLKNRKKETELRNCERTKQYRL